MALNEQLRQRRNRERRLDKSVSVVLIALSIICTVGMVIIPIPWKWWLMGAGITIVVLGSTIIFGFLHPRHMRRLREINELESEALRDLAQRN